VGQQYADFLAVGGQAALKDSVDSYVAKGNLNFTRLSPTLGEADPDDAFSRVPYEKGFSLLLYLERKMGGPAVFEPYLLKYVETFQRKAITSDEFKTFFITYFTDAGLGAKLEGLDWDHFFYGEGPIASWTPIRETVLDSSLATNALNLAKAWLSSDEAAIRAVDTASWSTKEWEVMLLALIEAETPMSRENVCKLISAYKFTESGNSEIRFGYQRLALMAGCGPEDESTKETIKFLVEQGRMKFVRPLYRALYKNPSTKDLAICTFEENRSMYHNIAAKMIHDDLGLRSKI